MKEIAMSQKAGWKSLLMSVLSAGVLLQGSLQAQTSGKPRVSEPAIKAAKRLDKAKVDEVSEHGGGPTEGIHVHGHWVIDVRSPDGKLVSHREFENSYSTNFGILPLLLSRNDSTGLWGVALISQTHVYAIDEPQNGNGGNLSIQPAPGSGNIVTQQSITLSGSRSIPSADTITSVQSLVGACQPSVAPQNCIQGPTNLFTLANLSPGISVAAGQFVTVTVTISFS